MGHFSEHSYPAFEQLVLQYAQPRSHILDLCCGTGHLTRKLLDHNFVVTGIDGSTQMIEYARKMRQMQPLSSMTLAISI